MKIAVCLSGMMRNFEYTFPRFKKYIIDDLKPDIFFSGYPNKNGINYCGEKIIDLYNPKKIILRNYDDNIRKEICLNEKKYLKNKRSETPINNILSQFYNIYTADNLRQEYELENKFTYDVVIRCRIDVYFFRNFLKEELIQATTGLILIPEEWDFKEVNSVAVTDSFAMSNSKNMKKYSSLYKNIEKYYEQGCLFHPETLTGYHLQKENLVRIPVKRHGWYKFENLDGLTIERKDF